jgi:C-terminal processing protease CtpA/Prc
VLLSPPVWGATRNEPKGVPTRLTARDLQEDFRILREALETLHPGLYRYNSKSEMEAHFAALQKALGREQTLQEAYVALSVFLAKIRCGHTYPNFFNQTQPIARALFQHRDRVPFYFRWVDEHMIVTRNFSSDERLRAGAEILAINGVPTATVLRRLMTIARADGSNDAKRVSLLEVSGLAKYEAFDIYFPLFFPSKEPSLRLQVRTEPNARPRTIQVAPLSYEERLASVQAMLDGRSGGDTPVWRVEHLEPGLALLRMPTWALYNSPWDWKGFLEEVFSQLEQRQVSHLIVDLRGNEGGLDVGDVLLSRLIHEDLRLAQFKRLVRYRRVPDSLAPYLDTWDPSFKDWGDAAIEPAKGFFTLTKYDDDARGNVITPASKPFRGRMTVLVDAANSSATFQFEQVLQQHKLATLVGQPTGGNQRGINGGAFFFLRLPKSGIEVDLPLIGRYPLEDSPDAGLQPDVYVKPRVEDIARGVDTELEKAKSLVPASP